MKRTGPTTSKEAWKKKKEKHLQNGNKKVQNRIDFKTHKTNRQSNAHLVPINGESGKGNVEGQA